MKQRKLAKRSVSRKKQENPKTMLKKMKKEKEEKKTKSACLHMVPSRAILRPGIVMVVFSSLLLSILLDGYFMNSCIWSFVSLFLF